MSGGKCTPAAAAPDGVLCGAHVKDGGDLLQLVIFFHLWCPDLNSGC